MFTDKTYGLGLQSSQVLGHLAGSTPSPVVVTSAQEGWKAADLWSFDFFGEAFGTDNLVCTDKVSVTISSARTLLGFY